MININNTGETALGLRDVERKHFLMCFDYVQLAIAKTKILCLLFNKIDVYRSA